MQITIGHLYPNELTLYGENGNIKALKYALEQESIKVSIININKEDKIDFNKIDFLYIGSGRKEFLEAISTRLEPLKEDFLDYIKKDKVFLVTGNAISIFSFLNLYEIEYYENRRVADVEATTSLCKGSILGFQNTDCLIKSTNHILFNIDKGYGNNDTLMEGYQEHNFYATSIIGPILARNDKLTNYFVDTLIKNNK